MPQRAYILIGRGEPHDIFHNVSVSACPATEVEWEKTFETCHIFILSYLAEQAYDGEGLLWV